MLPNGTLSVPKKGYLTPEESTVASTSTLTDENAILRDTQEMLKRKFLNIEALWLRVKLLEEYVVENEAKMDTLRARVAALTRWSGAGAQKVLSPQSLTPEQAIRGVEEGIKARQTRSAQKP